MLQRRFFSRAAKNLLRVKFVSGIEVYYTCNVRLCSGVHVCTVACSEPIVLLLLDMKSAVVTMNHFAVSPSTYRIGYDLPSIDVGREVGRGSVRHCRAVNIDAI